MSNEIKLTMCTGHPPIKNGEIDNRWTTYYLWTGTMKQPQECWAGKTCNECGEIIQISGCGVTSHDNKNWNPPYCISCYFEVNKRMIFDPLV